MAHHSVNTVAFDNHIQTWVDGAGNNPAGFSMTPSFVGVIDIGQGSTNAVFNQHGQVILYFDLGGGAGTNRFTFPDGGHNQLGPRLCAHAHPRFVLSHWDWDHWRGAVPAVGTRRINAIRAAALQAAISAQTTWAANAQGMGPLHLAIRNKLKHATDFYERNTVGGGQFHDFGSFRLILCAYLQAHGGPDNNTGFALRIEDPANPGQFMLLPGDAHYPNIQHHNCNNALVGLVATHHGESTVQAAVPAAHAGGASIAYSSGPGNKYGHVRTAGAAAYVAQGFADGRRFQTSGREAAAPHCGPRGNVVLRFASTPAGPGLAGTANVADVSDAALAILAAATTAAKVAAGGGGSLSQRQIGHIAAAAAYQATGQAAQPHAAQIATMMADPPLPPFGPWPVGAPPPPAQTTLQLRAPALGGAPANDLADTLAEAPNACAGVQAAACQNYLNPVGEIIARGHSRVAVKVTNTVNGVAAWQRIGTRSASAAYRVFTYTTTPGKIGKVATRLAGSPVATTLQGLVGGGVTPADIGTAAARAVFEAAHRALGRSDRNAESPPLLAATVFAHVQAQALPNVTALLATMLAVAAAMAPHVPVHPETPILAKLTPAQRNTVRDLTKPAVAAAHVGVTLVGNHHADIAKVAVAAAMAAIGAAAGLPQPGCHRHPRQCGNRLCSLTLHYG